MSSIRLRLAALCLVAALPLSASEPDFLKEEAVFPVVGDLTGVTLQYQAGTRGLFFPTFPTYATHAGDDRLFVTLRDGRIKIVVNGGTLVKPFLDLRNLVGTEGEGGLLSMAFHPRYAQNGLFFVSYTDKNIDTVIARYRVKPGSPNEADPASAKVLLKIDQPFANHNGGQIQFGPDGYLYIGMGDGGAANDPQCRAQRDDTLLGKMLRIDVDQNADTAPFYGIPDDNPYRGNDGVPDEVWARGLRNPWRFSFDRETGGLYIADVGQGAREEVNFQPAGSPGGENYGWKVMEGTLCAGRDACPASTPPCNSAELTLPILEYQNDGQHCSVTGGFVYRGSLLPQLRGTYLFGDFCNGQIWGARQAQGGGWEVRRLAGFGSGLTSSLVSFGEDRRGEIYVLTTSFLWRFAPPRKPDQVGLFDPSTATFRLKTSQTTGPADISFRFGRPGKGWIPLTGDWDGDGDDTIGYWDRGTKSFRLKNSLAGGGADIRFFLPQVKNSWIPLVGDWNGDGRDSVGFYDPATAIVRIKNVLASGGFGRAFQVGQPRAGLVPLAGDWDGDGRDSIGIYDPQASAIRLRNVLGDGTPVDVVFEGGFNVHGFPPIIGDWDGDGVDMPGRYENEDNIGFFTLFNLVGNVGGSDFQVEPARSEWVPLAGKW